ncbi:MAG TPA: N-acetyl-D-Glu racemase DgcA [Steroidobacteraceae bacterium]|jgi:L-alanine-DL-glutamate epimerase-like enolase superfamily enzyme|nr:N-acetyl-D-Glu racemase DgcA [Steroidobacteraceae bacterium]
MKYQLSIQTRVWPLREPFVIARSSHTTCEVIVVQLAAGGHVGRGEAVGVDYHGETIDSMRAQIEGVRSAIERGIDRGELLEILPAGGARNALDAALWDLEAKRTGTSVWALAGIARPRAISTCLTIGIRSIAEYEARARALARYEWIKIKVSDERPLEAVEAVRRGAPSARLVVDANQAWSVATLQRLAPALAQLRVDLLEQPVRANDDAPLANLQLPVPVCADEPANTLEDLPRLIDRYDFVNIKLDKSGGLTAALDFAHAARAAGMRLMVGCMVGGSLAMAPGMVLAQLCEIADLDGPLLQAEDWPDGIDYRDGVMSLPSRKLWG